ncbi:putative LSR2-like protein [Gordonia araii NBRC 100433]|uniref:Putative LSR2-like protein n=1 Tax=Gordonia araii NBRC 100433 TaxID=1073574 RepID=G7H1P3_9ACTN|nr:Lsr2 family protein [Gordonia araii]NNG99082.1 Lsr2 family protein [Gordonia araii NBRC 100433]GAB09768.1 putative LSR2-like protein [Gordonia araii NBRC 100433]
MARKAVIQVFDDLDGKQLESHETVRFSVDGKSYEFDTSPSNAAKFRDSLAKYISVSRSVRSGGRRQSGGRGKQETQKIRDWANANGYTVSDRGRIPGHIVEAYDAAN